jgi:hypothetical protein
MALDKAVAGLPIPLHPGAARYYKEAGLEVPERLIADQAQPARGPLGRRAAVDTLGVVAPVP